jgi:cation/acetate symporter
MVGTAGLPHVIVRFFTVKKVQDARLSAGYALIFIAILYTTAPAIAVFARTNLIETVSNQSYTSMPEWFKKWEGTGLLTFTDKNDDAIIQYTGVEETNELTIDKDIMVLANPEIAKLPNWVVALVAAGGLAAALSTAAGLLLVISTSIAHDLFKKVLSPDLNDKGELRVARMSAAVAVIVAGYFGYNPPGFVAEVVAFAFGLAAASFFPAIIMGIFSRRINKQGMLAGMITGLVFTIGYIVAFKGVFISPLIENIPSNWLFGISPEGIGTLGMVINFLVTGVVSHMTPAPPEKISQMIDEIRRP